MISKDFDDLVFLFLNRPDIEKDIKNKGSEMVFFMKKSFSRINKTPFIEDYISYVLFDNHDLDDENYVHDKFRAFETLV